MTAIEKRIQRIKASTPGEEKKAIHADGYLLVLILLIVMGSYAFSIFSKPAISVSVNKMNKIYIGLDNPVTIAVAGIPSEKVKVESDKIIIEDEGNGHYNLRVNQPGVASLKITAEGHASKEVKLRVRRIPDPMAKISNSSGGVMGVEQMQKSEGINAVLERFEYDAQCVILGFKMTVVKKNQDPVEVINKSWRYNKKSQTLIQNIESGDIIYFDGIRCKCPGDMAGRMINAMVFKIK